ncbi:MAG: tetratricopeptide repeat protein [Bacteroidales bacterium]|nr:tetratricopeptide repeat protein [Bacteroidales bacterium]
MKLITSISFLFLSILSTAQKMPSDYFEEASKYFEDEKFDEAIKSYQYIVDYHSKNELYPRAFYNIGYIYFIQKKYDKAIPVFKKILESNFNEKEDLGGNIMVDSYTNYKHKGSKILSEIYYAEEKYDTALYYLALSDTTFPYLHFCGNENASNNIYIALRYADIYQKLKQPEKAIEKLLPTVFITLADNLKVIEELKKLLTDKKGLKKKLDNSLNKIYPKKIDREDYSYTKYYFKFLNVEIAVPNNYEDDKKKFDKDKAIKEIKQTNFYKMIEQLR